MNESRHGWHSGTAFGYSTLLKRWQNLGIQREEKKVTPKPEFFFLPYSLAISFSHRKLFCIKKKRKKNYEYHLRLFVERKLFLIRGIWMMDSIEKGGVVFIRNLRIGGNKRTGDEFPSIAIYSDTTAINWQVIDFPRNHLGFSLFPKGRKTKRKGERRKKKERDICLMFYFVGKPSTCLLKNYK